MASPTPDTVYPELVEGLFFFLAISRYNPSRVQCFDKLSMDGLGLA